ncbi:dihydrodipicolinate synthase family protein [Natrinema saccharevitans]|uniref:Dihydrodipicolinate synthase family protein n=1 Tax=Natrinema saccharevitans TaxID=301967 RepID=A0A1S8AVF1_9EURY|nr:dihydrodipicolinate synthase family protein [Natrinema saccharevitans]OLZ40843.1 dihydrodipicolinate synthase family protein [Natrinema saccharevitans]
MAQHDPGTDDPLSLRGVVPPTVTAFRDDEAVDYERTAAHARFVVDRGAHGVFPLGTNGEFPLLSGTERDRVVEAVVDEVGDEVPVIAGVGAPSTYRTVARAEHAEAVGADGIVVVTPYYYPLDGDGALEHYRRVAEAVDLPVYVYHIPSKTGNELSLETLAALAEIDTLAGVKDSSKDVPWLAQATDAHPDLTFLAGSDSLVFTGLAVGCSGAVSAVANVFPELVVDCYEAYDAGDRDRARELQSRIFAVRDALKTGDSYMSGVKTALRMRDFDAGPLRSPLRLADDESAAEMRDRLRDLELAGL